MSELSHLDEAGRARMVDVGGKGETERTAVAAGLLRMAPETLAMILDGSAPKGDVLAVARVAGIQGAKKTADLIPLCHPLRLTSITVEFTPQGAGALEVLSRVKAFDRTGVEMEALTAVHVACLTVYDMVKAVDRTMTVENIRLLSKTGGKSGDYTRQKDAP
jgi:cyclic pyranopterin phosphate synthase